MWWWMIVSAVAGPPTVEQQWMVSTCADDVLLSDAQQRASLACPASSLQDFTYQYREARRATGCEVWLQVWCAPPSSVPGYTPAGGVVQPTLYMDRDFKGMALSLGEGEVQLVDVPAPKGGHWNDKASAARVPDGWTLRLCTEPGGAGNCSDLTGDVKDLGKLLVGGDKASSARVVRGSLAPALACPRAFEHDGFAGRTLDLCESMPDLTGGSMDNRISSVLVPDGWLVRLCAEPGGGAPCKDLEQDERRLAGTSLGADTASSVEVVRRP